MNKKGQFSIIAALFVAVILIGTVIVTYSTIRNTTVRDQPTIQSAIDETNFAIKQILGFTVGYYGSVLKITGNSSYARELAMYYLHTGLVNIANMHPEWGTSFEVSNSQLYTYWYTNMSFSTGSLAVNYSLNGLGISGIMYETQCKLNVQVIDIITGNQAFLNITKDQNEPLINLGRQNFKFFRYENANSTWNLVASEGDIVSYANGTYTIAIPAGVDPYGFVIQVEDPRGIVVVASSFSRYTCTLSWNSTFYSTVQDENLVVELLQNGTMRWLGQNLQMTTQIKPVPPIPIKSIRVNQTINGVDSEVPFQIEDWGSEYRIPLGLSNNASVFSGRTMLVFLANSKVSKVTIWWNGSDATAQTSFGYENKYFSDNPQTGTLSNGRLTLSLKSLKEEFLYVDSFNGTYNDWITVGSSPYLNDDTSNYIYNNTANSRQGWFGFQDPTYSGIKSVRIQFECKCSGNEYFNFTLSDGFNTYSYRVTGLPSDYDWEWGTNGTDVSDVLNTWEKIANAKICVIFKYNSSPSSTVYVRRVRLIVGYDTTAWGIKSILGNTTLSSEFFKINGKRPTYGADPAYVIHNGIIRDIIHQESEWSGGISGCPNIYAHIIITLPANVTYYTYTLRAMFVNSLQSRSITEFSPIQLHMACPQPLWGGGWGQTLAENGTALGLPNSAAISNTTSRFYNFSSSQTEWMHHWAEFLKNGKGGGIMFTNSSNLMMYTFDQMAGGKAGALKVTDAQSDNGQCVTIEYSPISAYSASFQNAMDLTFSGAVVNFDGTTPIYREDGGSKTGLWILVEYPPTMTAATES